MDSKSEEMTGDLFTKSESRIEDLLDMMHQVQETVHTFTDGMGITHCFERKIVRGDNKTASWHIKVGFGTCWAELGQN